MLNRSNPRIGLATAAGVVVALLLSEISLRPWAGQLYRFDVQPLSADRIQSPTKIVRYYGEGIATSHFSPSRARLTGRAPVASAPWIVIMGDSFVEGLQINDSETMARSWNGWPRRLTPSMFGNMVGQELRLRNMSWRAQMFCGSGIPAWWR